MARTPNPALTRDGVFLNAPRARRAISDHVREAKIADRVAFEHRRNGNFAAAIAERDAAAQHRAAAAAMRQQFGADRRTFIASSRVAGGILAARAAAGASRLG